VHGEEFQQVGDVRRAGHSHIARTGHLGGQPGHDVRRPAGAVFGALIFRISFSR